jgi:hypothetical protein
MNVGLFIPCCIDAFFPEVGIATLQPAGTRKERSR